MSKPKIPGTQVVINTEVGRDPAFVTYAEYMANEIRKTHVKIPPTTTQCASTQVILDRPVEDDYKHWLRHLPDGAQIKDKEGNIYVGRSSASPQDIVIVEDIRRRSKNTQGDAVSFGASSTTEESKNRAVEAFTYTPPAAMNVQELAKLTSLATITELKEMPEEVKEPKKSLASKILHKLWKFGIPIDRFTRKELDVGKADE